MNEVMTVLRVERPYRRLLSASLLSGIGSWFNNVALLSLLLHLTGSGLAIGITLAVRTLPYLVMGPIGGILADRINRKTILLISDFARVAFALSFLLVHSLSQVWIAYAATLGLALFSALYSPARTAVIPQLVRPQHVIAANSLEQSTTGLVMALGSALGGLVTASFGVEAAFIVNAASFLASGLICWSIRFPNNPFLPQYKNSVDRAKDLHLENSPAPSFWAVFHQSRLIQIISIQALLWSIGGGVINVLVSVYGFQVFHGGNLGVGILYGALGVGFLISGLIAHRFAGWLRLSAVSAAVLEGLGHVFVSQSPNLWVAALFLVLSTIGAGVSNASIGSLVMKSVSQQVHGRVFALFDTTSSITIALSMMATGFLLDHIPARTLGFGAAALLVCTALITGVALLRIKLPTDVSQETGSTSVDLPSM